MNTMCLMTFRDGLLTLLADGPLTVREMARILKAKPDRVRGGLEVLEKRGLVLPDPDALADPRWRLSPDVDVAVFPAVVRISRKGPDGTWAPLVLDQPSERKGGAPA